MADNLGSIAILLEIVDKASPELEKFNKTLESSTSSLKQKFTAFGTAVAAVGAGVTGALAAMTAAALTYADEMGKAAQKSGIAVESFSAINYAAKLADVSTQELTASFEKLSKSLVDSQDPNSKQAAAFEYLGIKTKDAAGKLKDGETIFKEVAEAFSKMPDGVSKSAVAMDIFGKSGANLIPLLNAGKDGLEAMRLEAERLGVVISEQTAKSAEDFNDNMTRLKNGTLAFGLAISQTLLPTLDVLVQQMIASAKSGEDFKRFAEGIGEVFRFIVKVGAGVIFTFNAVGKGLGAIGAAVAAILRGDFGSISTIFNQYKQDVKDSAVATADFMKKIDDAKPLEKATDGVKGLTKAYKDYKGTTGNENQKKYEDLINQIQREIDGVKNLTFAEQIRFELAKGKYKDLDAAQKKHIEGMLKEADAARLVNEATANLKKINDDISKAQTDTDAAAKARLADATTYLNLLQTQGQAAADAWRAINDAVKPLEAQRTILQELLDKAKAANDTQGVIRYTASITALNQQIEYTKNQLQGVVDKTADAGRATQIWNTYIQSGRNELQLLKDAANQLEAAFLAGKITAQEFTKAMDEIRLKQEALTESSAFNTYIAATRNQIQKLTNDAGELTKEFNAGKITADEYATALKKIDDTKFNLLKKELTDLEKAIQSAATNMQSDMSTFFFDMMNGKMDNLATMFKKTIDRMVADLLASQLTNLLFGTLNQQTGSRGAGGVMTDILSTVFGGLGKRENGGPVRAGVPYIVGEKRPEVFIPSSSGTIAPSVSSGIAGGGANTAVTFYITAMDSQDVMRSMEKIKRPLTDLITGTKRAYNK